MKRKRLIGLVLALLGGTLLLIFIVDKPPALPAVMILPSGPLALKSGRVPDRWIPAIWVLLHRACEFFLGPPRQVGIAVQRIETSETVASVVARLSLGQPQAQSNGVSVWILPESTLVAPKGAATITSMARITVAEQQNAGVRMIDKAASYSADFFSRLERETIDLSSRLIVTANGQTNFLAGLRAQLPYGHALLVLDVRHPESPTNRMEFVITADEYDAKGNKVRGKTGGK
jgi:hypothetical protein